MFWVEFRSLCDEEECDVRVAGSLVSTLIFERLVILGVAFCNGWFRIVGHCTCTKLCPTSSFQSHDSAPNVRRRGPSNNIWSPKCCWIHVSLMISHACRVPSMLDNEISRRSILVSCCFLDTNSKVERVSWGVFLRTLIKPNPVRESHETCQQSPFPGADLLR